VTPRQAHGPGATGDPAPGYWDSGELPENCTIGGGTVIRGSLAFKLPRPEVEAELQFREGREPLDLKLDTVVVDTDAMQVRLLMKGEANVHRRLLRLSEIRIRSGREA